MDSLEFLPFSFENNQENILLTNENDSQFILSEQQDSLELYCKRIFQKDNKKNSSLYFRRQIDEQSPEESQSSNIQEWLKPQNLEPQIILLNKSFQIPRLLSEVKSVYLFSEQFIDVDYLKSLALGEGEKYLKENSQVQIFKSVKKVHQVIHRADNKYIEVSLENIQSSELEIIKTIQYLKSLNNKDLMEAGEIYQSFWDNNINSFKEIIKQDGKSESLKILQTKRQNSSQQLFKDYTSSLHQNKLIYYHFYKVNYEKYIFEPTKIGYSPLLYELIAGNSYSFIDLLQKEGLYEPTTLRFRIQSGLQRAISFYKNKIGETKGNKTNTSGIQQSELITFEQFIFPALLETKRFNLTQEFDQSNNLTLKTNDLLAVSEFTIENIEEIMKQLQEVRGEQEFSQMGLISSSDLNSELEFDFLQTEFFQRYYSDQISDLMKKGNKWFKRCGYAELPSKFLKKS